jgi:K(+)-stimulated pyrophosphate-energized sodium pump
MVMALSLFGVGGLYGTAPATIGMLASCGYILAMDTFAPIIDKAGGIIEMSGAAEEVRRKTDRLDAVGNTTKAPHQRVCDRQRSSGRFPAVLRLYG